MAATDSLQWEQSKQVSTNLVVRLNGGSTEGTNKFTYNGSLSKTVNITPSSIGAINTAGTGLSKSGTTLNHASSITAGNGGPTANTTVTAGGSFTVPYFTYNNTGHITGRTNRTITLNSNLATDSDITAIQNILNEAIYVKAFSTTVSVVANGRTDFGIPITEETGYSMVGIMSLDYRGSDKSIAIGKTNFGSGLIYISVQNLANTAKTTQFVANCLFVKNAILRR